MEREQKGRRWNKGEACASRPRKRGSSPSQDGVHLNISGDNMATTAPVGGLAIGGTFCENDGHGARSDAVSDTQEHQGKESPSIGENGTVGEEEIFGLTVTRRKPRADGRGTQSISFKRQAPGRGKGKAKKAAPVQKSTSEPLLPSWGKRKVRSLGKLQIGKKEPATRNEDTRWKAGLSPKTGQALDGKRGFLEKLRDKHEQKRQDTARRAQAKADAAAARRQRLRELREIKTLREEEEEVVEEEGAERVIMERKREETKTSDEQSKALVLCETSESLDGIEGRNFNSGDSRQRPSFPLKRFVRKPKSNNQQEAARKIAQDRIDRANAYALVTREKNRTANIHDPATTVAVFSESFDQVAANDEMLKVVVNVQSISTRFNELIAGLDGKNVQLGRVLEKIRSSYVKLFERMLQTLSQLQEHKDVLFERQMEDMREQVADAKRATVELERNNTILAARAGAQEVVFKTQHERIDELDAEVDYLRGMLRAESEDLLERVRTAGSESTRQKLHTKTTVIAEQEAIADGKVNREMQAPTCPSNKEEVELALEEPLNSLDRVVDSFERQGEQRELTLSNMSRLLQAAEKNAKVRLAEQAKAVHEQITLRASGQRLVQVKEKGTCTVADKVSPTLDKIEVSSSVSYQTLWLKAFNLARCPRCKREVQDHPSAKELVELEAAKAQARAQARAIAVKEECQRQLVIERRKVKEESAKQRRAEAQATISELKRKAASDETQRAQRTAAANADAPNSKKSNSRPGGNVKSPAPLAPNELVVDFSNLQVESLTSPASSAFRTQWASQLTIKQQTQPTAISSEILAQVLNRNHTGFCIPQHALDFMVNLPQTISEAPPRTLEWILERIDQTYSDKLVADTSDAHDGLAAQALGPFLIEQFLFTHGVRRLAELHLYDLLFTLRVHMNKHPRLHMFARFLGAVAKEDQKTQLCNVGILRAFLIVRGRLLIARPWARRKSGHDRYDSDSDSSFSSLEDEEEGQCTNKAPDVVHHGLKTYIPISRTVSVIRRVYDTILPPRKLSLHCKAIEKSAVLYTTYVDTEGKEHTELKQAKDIGAGDRTTIRMNMRKAMLGAGASLQDIEVQSPTSPKKSVGSAKPSSPNTRNAHLRTKSEAVLVDADMVLESFVKVMLAREKYVQEKLEAMFIEADDDGNGVLSFDEFSSMIKSHCPKVSKRKALRMFRDACTRAGPEAGLALTPTVFKEVCLDYDVVPLLPFEQLS